MGARFLREHPASASSRKESAMEELLSTPGVSSAVGHVCRFGVRIPQRGTARGPGGLGRKPARWARPWSSRGGLVSGAAMRAGPVVALDGASASP
eukprot:13281110-Alexandrium_andersonii.AAC.1